MSKYYDPSKKMYYGFDHIYSRDLVNEDGYKMGHIAIFASKESRDRWMMQDENREPISSKYARKHMIKALSWDHDPRTLRTMPIKKLVEEYESRN